jgi:hypothetical protein
VNLDDPNFYPENMKLKLQEILEQVPSKPKKSRKISNSPQPPPKKSKSKI